MASSLKNELLSSSLLFIAQTFNVNIEDNTSNVYEDAQNNKLWSANMKTKSKKRIALTFGAVAILAGLLLASFSNTQIQANESTYVQNTNQWSISNVFEENETIGFSFRPSYDWPIETPDMYYVNVTGTYAPVKYLEANITNPNLNHTAIRIILVIDLKRGTATPLPDYFEAFNNSLSDWQWVNSSRGFYDSEEAILISKGYPRIDTIKGESVFQLGKTTVSGEYNLTCQLDPENVLDRYVNGTIWPHRAFPPAYLMLYKTKENTIQPYASLLPVGLATATLGITVIVWSFKRIK